MATTTTSSSSRTGGSSMTVKPLMGKHVLPPLPYSYDALEPTISASVSWQGDLWTNDQDQH
jgi:hypothetical protein